MHRRNAILIAALGVFAILAAASASGATDQDQTNIRKLGQGGRSEVLLGNLVAGQASDPRVIDFAHLMVLDHSMNGGKLQPIAAANGVTIPDEMDNDHKKMQAKLDRRPRGTSYDRTYMDEMVKDHTKDLQEFRKAADRASDPQFKSWIQQSIPALQKHLRLAKIVRGQL